MSSNTTVSSSNATATHHHKHHNAAHIDDLINEAISKLAPFSAMILTICVVFVFAFRLYFIEKFLMNTKAYKSRYLALQEDQKRSLVNHHVAATLKVILLFTAVYPFLSIAFGHLTPHTPFAKGSSVTLGDVMIVCSNLFTVMYVFELFYRVNVSPISAAHHIGAIVIAQTAIAISLNFDHEVDAVIEFVMCFVWGAFDVLAELWPHLAMITYRVLPPQASEMSASEYKTKSQAYHSLMSRIFLSTAALEVFGTTLETIIVFWLFASLWSKWTLSFRVVTPVLHFLFSCAQGWGAYVFWCLGRKEGRKAKKIAEEDGVSKKDIERIGDSDVLDGDEFVAPTSSTGTGIGGFTGLIHGEPSTINANVVRRTSLAMGHSKKKSIAEPKVTELELKQL